MRKILTPDDRVLIDQDRPRVSHRVALRFSYAKRFGFEVSSPNVRLDELAERPPSNPESLVQNLFAILNRQRVGPIFSKELVGCSLRSHIHDDAARQRHTTFYGLAQVNHLLPTKRSAKVPHEQEQGRITGDRITKRPTRKITRVDGLIESRRWNFAVHDLREDEHRFGIFDRRSTESHLK